MEIKFYYTLIQRGCEYKSNYMNYIHYVTNYPHRISFSASFRIIKY